MKSPNRLVLGRESTTCQYWLAKPSNRRSLARLTNGIWSVSDYLIDPTYFAIDLARLRSRSTIKRRVMLRLRSVVEETRRPITILAGSALDYRGVF